MVLVSGGVAGWRQGVLWFSAFSVLSGTELERVPEPLPVTAPFPSFTLKKDPVLRVQRAYARVFLEYYLWYRVFYSVLDIL